MPVLHPSAEEFESVIGSGAALVDFYADWCGPCKMLAPVIDKLSEEYDGRLKVVKVNVDEERELAARFEVASIPSVVILKDGEQRAFEVGFQPISVYREIIDGLI